jgi:hypothetical protein
MKHPCMTMCEATNRIGEAPEQGGGGGGEGGEKGKVLLLVNNYTFAFWASGHRFSFFSRLPFQSYFTKEVVVFLRQC